MLFPTVSCAPAASGPAEVNRITLSHVAFANLIDSSLYLATFDGNPFGGKDQEFVIADAASLVTGAKPTPALLPGKVTWPNTVTKAPASLFGQEGVLIAGGFLVPGRSNGGLTFAPKTGDMVNLFTGNGYFYHQSVFYDVNGDGKLDILTCRATKPLIGSGKGDLVYLQPKDRTKPLGPWTETVIGKGCDTFFTLADVNGDGKVDLVAAEFWGSKMTLIESPDGRFDTYANLKITTLDATQGQMFGVQAVDLNGDGKKDILATNHDGKGKGGVFGYELVNGQWTRHDLSVGFPILQGGTNQAAPGAAEAFFPTSATTGKPTVVVSGDGNQQVWLLTPNSQNASDWTYTRSLLHNCASTSGGVAVGDANKDGKTEIYIPCYDNGYLVVYSY
ncbi:hypothetical protein EDD86DRAFT_73329 [Gorgonomyces haynaldii]|nr:hypothetical protein EDD86DRAFT_73329 [Gorgonomyces haynaldii]